VKVLGVLARFLHAKAYAVRTRFDGARKGEPTHGSKKPAITEPSPEDPSLPHLEAAKDPELMREVFQRHLRPLDKEAYQVQECQIYRIRYRQASCRVQYASRASWRLAQGMSGASG